MSVDVVEIAKALASPTRLQILRWLKDPTANFTSRRDGDLGPAGVCATLIAEKVGASQPTVSRHFDVLRRSGLVRSERVAGWNYHARDETAIQQAREALDTM